MARCRALPDQPATPVPFSQDTVVARCNDVPVICSEPDSINRTVVRLPAGDLPLPCRMPEPETTLPAARCQHITDRTEPPPRRELADVRRHEPELGAEERHPALHVRQDRVGGARRLAAEHPRVELPREAALGRPQRLARDVVDDPVLQVGLDHGAVAQPRVVLEQVQEIDVVVEERVDARFEYWAQLLSKGGCLLAEHLVEAEVVQGRADVLGFGCSDALRKVRDSVH